MDIANINDLDVVEIAAKHYPEFSGIHPACLAVPVCSQDVFVSIVESIATNGLREPILRLPDKQLIDGRTRLLACYVAKQEIRVADAGESVDPWELVKILNLDRRDLSVGQRAIFGMEWKKHETLAAKKRQRASGGDRKSEKAKSVQDDRPEPIGQGQARDKVGERVGVSGRSIDRAAAIAEYAPDLLGEVKANAISLRKAYGEASRRRKEIQSKPIDKPAEPTDDTVEVVTLDGTVTLIKRPAKVQFNKTNQSVDWAAWTWNPVTGCEHGCAFCYAREIAYSERMSDYYPNKFEPTFHAYRLEAPANTSLPNQPTKRDGRVFVCSMADLFGKWVPTEWIQAVFDACLATPRWQYMFLTKWPARYSRMPLIERAWYGATITKQADVKRVESGMAKVQPGDDRKRWVSLEPMLGPVRFNDLGWCDLLVIGSMTATNQPTGRVEAFAPEFDWIVDVVNQCREADVPYFLKANLGLELPGMCLPKMEPR